MKTEQIQELFTSFEAIAKHIDDIECWSARDLQDVLGYSKWDNFLKVIEKAKIAAEGVQLLVSDHFADVGKMVALGSGSEREIPDIMLTRYACYLIAQNGDATKPAIAFAQTYFAVQTRKQEVIEKRLLDVERVTAREKLTQSEKRLSGVIYERGVNEKDFAIIRSEGDRALFGGYTTQEMKNKLSVPDKRPLADFLPTLTIKAKDFATELTHHNVVEKDLKGRTSITNEHVENNQAIRKILKERGVQPEKLPPAEDVKKVQRKLASEDKKALVEQQKGKKNDK